MLTERTNGDVPFRVVMEDGFSLKYFISLFHGEVQLRLHVPKAMDVQSAPPFYSLKHTF
jgi:hypothetical protein